MATISSFSSIHNPTQNPCPSFSTTLSRCIFRSLKSSGSWDSNKSAFRSRRRATGANSISTKFSSNPITSSSLACEYDIVIVGAGIIGLTIAREFLKKSNLSVAIVDSSVPLASGATGAGQGYIWMAGKTPGGPTWELGMRGKKLWEELADSIKSQGMSPLQELGWKKTGSLLVGNTSGELIMLKEKVKLYSDAGLRAEFLSNKELASKEPLVDVGEEGGAAFLPDDCQMDASRAVLFIQKENTSFGSRYAEFFNDPVIDVLRSGSGEIEGVRTASKSLYCKKAVVVAAGSWSGSLMKIIVEKFNIVVDVPVKPRKGHLLVIENFNELMLNHGLMEVGYMDHRIASSTDSGVTDYDRTMSISMTATLDGQGNLVLGSSRQFAGFHTEVDESIVYKIWKRAGDFFPILREVTLEDLSKNHKVRVGLRPYMPDGKPIISCVPGIPNAFVAAGHEGVGLTLAFGTAEMIFDMVFENPEKIDYSPFSFEGR